ncbi:dynein regulatory complex subunit 7-like isoform X2 [Octopus sinensis]|uniref:Dynein regulatory complex subunit 7 n=1 Tax=Octopus sinensis TaxID=2607531 RepID=A0A7E6F616_9MOLL|nr:dynein regulatory complex subunit 7-like isoform X2 [Octopus sinensis]
MASASDPEVKHEVVPIPVAESKEKKVDAVSSSVLSAKTKEDGDDEEESTKGGFKSEEFGSVDTTSGLEGLMETLSKIVVQAPHNTPRELEDLSRIEFPLSYQQNEDKEKKVLEYADNFRRQYIYLYRDRKPLLLFPKNECRVKKLVCTTIRPTLFPYPELYQWHTISLFVSDYLQPEMLYPSYELPATLLSPTTVLRRQRGTCFEYCTLLCSLLLGAGFDAYIVSGYATLHICSADEALKICPYLETEPEVEHPVPENAIKKYAVRPPKDLTSKFEAKQLSRAVKEKKENEERIVAEENARIAKLEEPAVDLMRGMRVHSWVLVLAGIREVGESFFIEPFTGEAEPLKTDSYLGIESVWNHQNYWVNMQDCSNGISKMQYDLNDGTNWEYIFPRDDLPSKRFLEEDIRLDFEDDEDIEKDFEKYLDMPPSWVAPLELSLTEFQMRYPNGKRVILYKKAKLEKFADYKMPDGLVTKISVFNDYERTQLKMVKEIFKHRIDKLYLRERNHETHWIIEYFKPGRECSLKEHCYKFDSAGPESDRTMIFYDDARVDGLQKRIETSTSMTEHFIGRKDLLCYKYVEFGPRLLVFAPQISSDYEPRPIQTIIEQFLRNPEKVANDDIAKRIFSQEKIYIQYHIGDPNVTYSTREFIKSSKWTDRNALSIDWSPEIHTNFLVGEEGSTKREIDVYNFVRKMITEEFDSRDDTRKAEMEKEKEELEAKKKKATLEVDYLAPFLARIGDPERLTREEAIGVKEACLADLKKRIEDKANLIQMRFEKETKELVKKQEWYQKNQMTMQKNEEDEYLKYCEEAIFRIHVLEVRLNRYKELAPMKYMTLDKKLKSDPRLSHIFRKSNT